MTSENGVIFIMDLWVDNLCPDYLLFMNIKAGIVNNREIIVRLIPEYFLDSLLHLCSARETHTRRVSGPKVDGTLFSTQRKSTRGVLFQSKNRRTERPIRSFPKRLK